VVQWKTTLLEMLKPKTGGIQALPRGFLSRLMEIYALYEGNATRKRQLHRRGEMSLEQIQEAIQYDKWRWRLTYQLSRFGERYKDHQATINDLQQAILREPEGLIAVLHMLARWTALLTREE
jgi:hypothetical protein